MAKVSVILMSLMGLLISAGLGAYAEPQSISVHATPVNLSLSGLRFAREDTIPFPYMGFSFGFDNRLYLTTEENKWPYACVFTENLGSHEFVKFAHSSMDSTFFVGDGVLLSPVGIGVLVKIDGKYDLVGPQQQKEFNYYYYASKQILVFGDGIHGRRTAVHFVGYLLSDRGVTKTLGNDEFLEYIKKNETGFSIKDGVLYYKGIEIVPSSYLSDDSGNWYHFTSVFVDGVPYDVIDPAIDGMTQNYQAWRSWDAEGNLWYLIYPKGEKDSAKLMYVGRDWGYKDRPERAKCKETSAPLFLRAKQDAFLLETLKAGDRLTILKRSSFFSGGTSEQWCRVKTESGLVGWTLAKNIVKSLF
jgi:hypothetical protein